MSNVSQDVGLENERKLLKMLDEMEQNGTPFPVNAKGGLYIKALWARLSEQPLEEISKAPSWFNGRNACKTRLQDIKNKLAAGDLPTEETQTTTKDEALADLLDSSSNKTLQMMKSRMNSLKETLDSERAEKIELRKKNDELQQEIRKLRMRDEMVLTGKTPH